MGLLGKKDKEPKAPKPKAPKPVVLSAEEKAVLAQQTARYRKAFADEGYDVAAECSYDPRTLMTPRFADFDHRAVHALDTPPVGQCVNIAVGETDGRIYAAWMFLAPLVVGEQIVTRMVQVAGVYVGMGAPTAYLTDDSCDEVFPAAAVEVFRSSPLSGGVWLEHGWLLTDFPTIQPDVNIAIAAWRHLSEVLDSLEPVLRARGCDFGQYRSAVDAMVEIFPSYRSALMSG